MARFEAKQRWHCQSCQRTNENSWWAVMVRDEEVARLSGGAYDPDTKRMAEIMADALNAV